MDRTLNERDTITEPSETLAEVLQLLRDNTNIGFQTQKPTAFDLPSLTLCAAEIPEAPTSIAKQRLTGLTERLLTGFARDVSLKNALKDFRNSELAKRSPDEAYAVLKTIEKVISHSDKSEQVRLNVQDRKLLGQQCLQLAANPYLCSQGRFNTCEMATLEKLFWKREPSAAIALIADAVLRGSIKGYDGKDFKLSDQPFKKDLESRNSAPAKGDRFLPSQIFQTALVERELKGRQFGVGCEVKYELRRPVNKKDSGERLVAPDGRVLWEIEDDTAINDPGIDFNRISGIFKSLTKHPPGKDPLVLASKDNLWYLPKERAALANMEFVDTKDIQKLEKALSALHHKKQFPLIVIVAVGSGDERDLHVATIHGYDAIRKRVIFHDQNEREDSAVDISTKKLLAMMKTDKLKPWQLPKPTVRLQREQR